MNIVDIQCSQPDNIISVREASQRLGIDEKQTMVLQKIFGLKYLPISREVTCDELIIRAVDKCISSSKVSKNSIRWVIHGHTSTNNSPFGESMIRKIQQRFDLKNACYFGMSLSKCAAIFKAFDLANNLFEKMNESEHILIIGGDITFTKILQFIPGTTIMSDGACAILLSKSSDIHRMLSSSFLIKGEFAGGIWNNINAQHGFENNYVSMLSETILNAVRKANVTLDNISYIFPHNVNITSWKRVAKKLNFSENKIYLKNVSKSAHCFGVDPFLNLKDAEDSSLINKGDYYVLATVGLGATFSAMVFRC